jgi:cytochrome P450 / NADPH-cytochrome P450 reductase
VTRIVPIPQPKADPLIGNIRTVDPQGPVQGLMRLARTYGPIFRLDLPGQRLIFISSQELVNEACDEQRFVKEVHGVLRSVRSLAGNGLFTAETSDPDWGKAHRILLPAFGPMGIRSMFDGMLDVADQMLLRWERFGESTVLDVADQMTRLTLDTIALCGFDYRFNSFYQNEMHPFIDAMVRVLRESGARTRRPELASRLMLLQTRRYEEDVRLLHDVADRLIAERKRESSAQPKRDLLDRMLRARDPVTGEALSDENIRFQLVTFLIAGHETTSGLLSFTLYLLLQNPSIMQTARALVDSVLGGKQPRVGHLARLRYLEQILMESLRLWPTAPAFGVHALRETTLGGRYAIKPNDTLMVLVPMLHRDTTVWGPDVEAFAPERFDPEAEAKLPPNAWKPFGSGQRACIGRAFAMQEAQLVLTMLLQRFDLIAADPAYTLAIKETLTLKPEGFRIRAKRRSDVPIRAWSSLPPPPAQMHESEPQTRPVAPATVATRLLVLYGSNTGSAQAFAQRIGSDAPARGYAVEVAALDEYAGRLPSDAALVILTASYEGHPPDNARQFMAALGTASSGALTGARFAVFGCGNRQWARTYQAIPIAIDAALEQLGAKRIKPRGEADASGDFFGAFDRWYATLWIDLANSYGKKSIVPPEIAQLTVEVVREGRSAILRQTDLAAGKLVENRELVDMRAPIARSKRHFEIELPEGMSYRTGDYLAVLPRNSLANVERALRRFGFAADSQVILHKRGNCLTSLPTGYPVSLSELLANYVELAQPATRSNVQALADATHCPPDRHALEALARADSYEPQVLLRRVSALDLLERFPACELSLANFLEMLPPLRARQYSISSSPLWNDRRCSLTIAVVDAPALSGQGQHRGVASHYLASSAIGTALSVAVRPGNPRFRPPADPSVPIVMICAGTGLAPFRGFIQERALQAAAGRPIGKTLLFFGCDHPEVDLLYREELEAWQAAGNLELRPTFSAAPQGGVALVQERVWQDRAEVAQLFASGATVYVCGDGLHMAPAVRETIVRIYRDAQQVTFEEAERWADEIERQQGRYVEDVFA